MNTAGFLLGKWIGRSLEICSVDGAENVQIKISGTYENTLDICFYLTLFQNGILETAYEVQKLFRHMPHQPELRHQGILESVISGEKVFVLL